MENCAFCFFNRGALFLHKHELDKIVYLFVVIAQKSEAPYILMPYYSMERL
ncbi:MAG: hypothetical protein LBI14_07175 [Treponema sp.]|jgi:hypothetical protein|nr:hypothetical protein [Treponema sp.]